MERRQPVVNIRVILLTGVGLIALLGFNVAGLPKQKSGRVYYVDAIRGNDANPGTLAAPWRTLSKAAKLMSSGDTCLVRAGVYREVIYPKRGQSFIAYPGEKPLITGCDPVSGWLQHSGNIYKAPVKTKVYDVFMSYKYMHKSRWPNFNGDYLDTTFWAKAHASRVGNTRDGIERLWRLVIGGATACFHRPEMGISLSAPATASLKAARKQESLIKLWEVEPASHLLTDREDNEAYLAAQHGQAYALYFTDGGEVGLGLKGFDGKFDVRWVDINTGKRGKYETIKDGRIAKIRAPKQGHSVAAVKRIAEEIEKKSARYQNRFSWEETHCEITPDGDIKWKPKPFILEKGSSIRYIDYENGNDNNDGLTKNTPWKHHPWDEKAEGKAKECRGIHTYIFKKGVVYRGRLIARDSGTEKEPIRLTVDPDWGRGEAYIYGSVKITGGWRKCIERLNVPEADKIWYIDMKEDFVPRAIWLVEGEKVTRIPVAREPDWIEDDPDDVLRNWWVWERVIQRGNNLIGRDSKNLTNPDPNYYKGAIVWTEGDNLIVTPTPSRVIDYNPQTSEITFLRGWRQPPVRGCRYFIEDKLEFLDSPGEYYYDKERKRLYIRLPNDENPNTKTMELAKEFNLIEIINQSNIEISGISFRFNNSLPDPLLRWIDTTEIYTAAIRATGTCKNIRIHHCKFEYLTKGIRFYAKDSDDIVDKIEVTDNEFSYTEHNAVEFKDGQLWGKTIPPFGRIKEVKILRNKFYHDGARPLRDYTPFTIYVHSGEVVEIAGNILEKCYGGGINVFCGKHHDIRDVPLIKVFIHHNKVKDCLLHSNDYGGIEVWQGGPAIVYNNIVINPVGPRRGQYVWTLENKRDFTYSSANLGFAYYADGQYKGYFFNNIAIGKSNQIGTTLCNAAAFIEVGGFLHAYFNNFIYKFGCAFRKQPSLNGVQRTWYLGNYIVDISDIVFDHQAAGESKPEMDVYDTIGYLWNTFSGNPKRGIGAFAPRQPISRNLDEFSEYLKMRNTLRYEAGITKQVPEKLNDMIKDYMRSVKIKFFVPYPLYKVVGEWNFYKNKKDPSFIFGENFYYSDEYMDRSMYHYIPWNNLKGVNVSEKSYKTGILENWVEGALEFDGEKVYCILPDDEIKKDYSFVYIGGFKYGEVERGKKVVYPGNKRQTVDMDKNSFLVEVVLKVERGEGGIVEKMGNGSGYSVYLKGGRVNLKIGYGKDYYLVYTKKRIDDNKWHHLIVEVDMLDKVGRIYVDGRKEEVIKEGEMKDKSISNTGDFIVGKSREVGYFKGLIDFLRISRGSLKDAETTIEEVYKWEFDGPFLRDFLGRRVF